MGNSSITSDVLGQSEWALKMRHRLPQIARHRYPVVITGPPGSGKRFLAQVVHNESVRREQPFVPIECGRLASAELFASQVFGHEEGSFSGSRGSALGCLRAAGEGTVLLGNVNQLPLESQGLLLDALKTGEFQPLGSEESVPLAARIMATSEIDLQKEVADCRFLSELYMFLEAISLFTVPLARRRVDIVPLARHFAALIAEDLGEPVKVFSPEAIELLRGYPWPGNITQLQEAVEEAFVFSNEPVLSREDFDFLKES